MSEWASIKDQTNVFINQIYECETSYEVQSGKVLSEGRIYHEVAERLVLYSNGVFKRR